ncbi:MAG: hypothetical protein D6720_04385 [Gammaproteobacteria bacterium]|nr:MAG: hypothetical protein D6720_04385 [Gammaproteobacteria bacterium]
MPRYEKVATAFRRRITAQCARQSPCPEITTATVGEQEDDVISTVNLIVAVGHKAARLARSRYPRHVQLHVMVSRTGYLNRPSPSRLSAIFLEQPPIRLLKFSRYLLPDHRRIGILLSSHTHWRSELEKADMPHDDLDLAFRTLESGREAGRAIRRMRPQIDVLLALPDPAIYNRNTLGTILLSTFRNGIPVVGFSQGMVKSGAVAALFSTPTTIGEEAADRALRILAGAPPMLRYPRRYETAVNRRVAAAMHLELPSDREIARWSDAP